METADTEDIYYAPISINDLGIGGGEIYGIGDKQGHHGTIRMVRNTVKIRLVYEETEI